MMVRYLFTFLALLLFTSSCDTEKTDDSVPAVALEVDKINVSTYELVSATVEPNSLKSESYSGTLGGESIIIGADKEKGKLAILIPDVEPGKQTLAVNLDGRDYKVDFIVKSTTISEQPDLVINKAIEDITFTDEELDAIHSKMAGLDGTEFLEENTAIIKQANQLLRQIISDLDADQKKEFAGIIAANPLLFSPEEDPTIYMDDLSFRVQQESPEEILDKLFERMEQDKNTLYAIGTLAAGAGLAGQPLLAAALGLVGIYKIYLMNNQNIAGLSKALVRFGEMLVDDIENSRSTANRYVFYKDKKYLIRVKSPYRNPGPLEMNSSESLMKGVVVALNEVSDVWIAANKMVSKFGSPLKGNAFHIKNVTNTKSKTLEVEPKFLLVSNVSNSKVSWGMDVTTEGWVLEFKTEETTPQDFTFDIIYKSGTGEESVLKYEATLDPTSGKYGWYVGKYTLAPYSDPLTCAPQAGEKGDVFFYFSPDKLVTYTRSILQGIPDIYEKDEDSFYPKPIFGSPDSLQFRHTTNLATVHQINGAFELDYLNIYPGIEITNNRVYDSHGWATLATEAGKGCSGSQFSDYMFEYKVYTQANYRGEKQPENLSQAEIKKILEM